MQADLVADRRPGRDCLAWTTHSTNWPARHPEVAELVKLRVLCRAVRLDEAADSARNIAPQPPSGIGLMPGPGCTTAEFADEGQRLRAEFFFKIL